MMWTLEDLDMAEIKEHIKDDEEYQKLITAFKEGRVPKELSKDHPIRSWSGSWETISMLSEDSPLVVNGEKVIIPSRLQKKIVQELHSKTHGSFGRMRDTIQESMIWKNWKKEA